MAFDYANKGAGVYSQPGKCVQAKSFKIDLAANNATTATAYNLGYVPKDAQILDAKLIVATSVSGSGVSAATIAVSVANVGTVITTTNVFSGGVSQAVMNTASYTAAYGNSSPTQDQMLQYTLTLTGGSTATAGVLYLSVTYVV